MPRILAFAIGLYFLGLWTEMYKRIFDTMTINRLNKTLPLSDKRIVAVSSRYFSLRRAFAKKEGFLQMMIFQYKGL